MSGREGSNDDGELVRSRGVTAADVVNVGSLR
jgi:hypothetical protein